MKKNRGSMRTLKDIALEKERLRLKALQIELKFSKQLKHTRKLFTPRNLLYEFRIQVFKFLAGRIKRMFA